MRRPFRWEASYPAGLDWGAPIASGTVTGLLDRAVARFGGRTAVEHRGHPTSFVDLGRLADGLAGGLGVGRGEAVGLLLPNTPAHPASLFGVLRGGGIAVHLSPLDPARAVARKLADSGARTLVTTNLPGTLPQAVQAWRQGACERLLVVDDRQWGDSPDAQPIPEGAAIAAGAQGERREVTAGDVALLQYTGGTTGLPRAAMLTHGNLTSAVGIYDAWNQGIGRPHREGDRVMGVLPLFHIYALTTILLRGLSNGFEILLRQRFDAEQALDDIERRRCTHFAGVPTMWIALVNHKGIGARDLSSLRVCSSGGAPLPHEVSGRLVALTGLRLGGGWGMTETSPAGTNLLPDRAPGPGEIGVPLPAVEIEVVALDDPRRVLPPGETGELRVRGPNVTPGYWQRPEENRAAFVDGWFLTGDIGRMDADGVFTLVDRKKDMLISGGFNVYPRAIEEAIHEHPDVREAAVIGVPDPYRGQAAKAYVVLRGGAAPMTLQGLRTFLAERLGRHELPAALEVREQLPHTPVGKLAKRELIAEERASWT